MFIQHLATLKVGPRNMEKQNDEKEPYFSLFTSNFEVYGNNYINNKFTNLDRQKRVINNNH